MRGVLHEDKIMKNAISYELPELASPEQCIGTLDVFFGPAVLKAYGDAAAKMFPRAKASLSRNASQAADPEFPLAELFLQELVDKKLFNPTDLETFDIAKADTHHGTWQHAPNLHRDTPPVPKDKYEETIAHFLQKLLSVLNTAARRARFSPLDLEFVASASDAIPGSSRKPDIAVIERGSAVSFETMRAVIEVKYCFTPTHRKDAVTAFVDRSWFMLDACDWRVHSIGATLCGSTFTGCLLDRGGFVSTFDIDIERAPLIFLQCFLALVIGTTGFDQEWHAETGMIDFAPPDQEEEVEDGPLADILSYDSSSQDILPSSTRGVNKGDCTTFTILARIFSHRVLTGRSTKVLIAERGRNSSSTFSESDETSYPSINTLAAAANPFFESTTANPSSIHTELGPQVNANLHLRLYPPREQVAIKDCWPTPDVIPEGYILEYLGGEDLAKSSWFNRIRGIPTKIAERFVMVDDPVTGKLVVDSTRLHRRGDGGSERSPEFERRVHYRLATEEVCVELCWFSHRKEFFTAILRALKAHQFAVEERSILHRDISPPNILLYIRTIEPALAVPDWQGNQPPPKRLALLGDWGTAAPLNSIPIFDKRPVRVSLEGTDEYVGYNACLLDRTGTVPLMATELLWDQWGDTTPHSPRHDLESFFWSILWSTCNFSGPYGQFREWPTDQGDPIAATHKGFMEDPPAWLKPGKGDLSFKSIVKSRLSFAGNFDRILQFVDPYWQVGPVIDGLKEMFDIFLPANLAKRGGTLETKVMFQVLPAVDHKRMVEIVQRILSGLSQTEETPPSKDTIIGRRSAWRSAMKLTPQAKVASFDSNVSKGATYQVFTTAMSLSQHTNARLHYQSGILPSAKRKRDSEGGTAEASTSRNTRIRHD